MKQKLTVLVNAFLDGLKKVLESPYRIIWLGLAVLYARDLITKADGGPLDYSIIRLKQIMALLSKTDVLTLLVILVLVIVLFKKIPGK